MFTSFKRLGVVIVASAVAVASFAQPVVASVRSGTYNIGRQLYGDDQWVITIATAVASRDELRINVVYQNVSDAELRLYCPADRQTLVVGGSRRIEELRSYCSERVGEEWSVGAGEILESWAVFPNDADLTTPFDLPWYNWGTVGGIALRRGLVNDPRFRELLTDLERFQAPAVCVSTVVALTREFGYPYGTLLGLISLDCGETLSQGAIQGAALFECVHRYPNRVLLCFGVADRSNGDAPSRLPGVSSS